MDRLIATNSVPAGSADTAPVSGTPQYATDGNPAAGVPATQWPAYQYNAIQEEFMSVFAAAGITPDRTKLNQLLASLQALSPQPVRVAVTGAFTLTVPPGMTRLKVNGLWGPGNSGGGSVSGQSFGTGGGGGGSGGFCSGIIIGLTPGQTISGVVGAPGTPSSITGYCTAGAGAAGANATSSNNFAGAGNGGVASNDNPAAFLEPIIVNGNPGESSFSFQSGNGSTAQVQTGMGGGAPFGGPRSHFGVYSGSGSAQNGQAGTYPGGGGEGGQNGGSGGAGQPGFLDAVWLP